MTRKNGSNLKGRMMNDAKFDQLRADVDRLEQHVRELSSDIGKLASLSRGGLSMLTDIVRRLEGEIEGVRE